MSKRQGPRSAQKSPAIVDPKPKSPTEAAPAPRPKQQIRLHDVLYCVELVKDDAGKLCGLVRIRDLVMPRIGGEQYVQVIDGMAAAILEADEVAFVMKDQIFRGDEVLLDVT